MQIIDCVEVGRLGLGHQRQRLAVYNEWLCTVFRIEGCVTELYDAAKVAIERGLAKRGMW